MTYIDESSEWINRFHHAFRQDFSVSALKVSPNTSIDEIVGLIPDDACDLIVIDYLLSEEGGVSFDGNSVVDAIRKIYPYFPVIMLTSHENEAMDNMDEVLIIHGKNILDGERPTEFLKFKEKIRHHIESYHKRKLDTEEEIRKLMQKQEAEGLAVDEEDRLTKLLILEDDLEPDGKMIPSQFHQKETLTQLANFVKETGEILEELKSLSR